VAATPEKKVKTAIKSWLDAHKFYHFSPIGGPFAVHGVPDIIVCAKGRFIGIECKAPGKEKNTTANQDDHISRINTAGGLSFVASSLDEVVVQFTTLGLV
jgi:hypothetical protein